MTVHSFTTLKEELHIKRAYILQSLRVDYFQPNTFNCICRDYDQFHDITFPEFENNQISILLGTDNIDFNTTTSVIIRSDTAPRSFATVLGWTIGGSTAKILRNIAS